MAMKQPGFQHEALIYAGPEDFLAGTLPFLRDALEADEPALVAVSQANTALLEGELGTAGEGIHFAEMEVLGRNPARIIPFWREFVDSNRGRAVRGIGEPIWPGRESAEIDECERHEALLNVAFSPPPAWSLLCPYDGRGLDDDVLEAVAHSHKTVARDGLNSESTKYLAKRDCFAGELTTRPDGASAFAFDRGNLAAVRRGVGQAARQAGLSPSVIDDLVVAASELAANSILHGGGTGTVHTWQEAGRLLVEFEDAGTIDEPLAGRLRPELTQEGGRGLWLAHQLCDLVQIRSGAGGTRVRLRAATA
jgi:anti-sigma regulatory factor (Ser/Thr protein kinase)